MKEQSTKDFPYFGKRLREIRKYLRLTQDQLSQKINITKATISAWENGHSNVLIKNVESVAEKLGFTFEELTQEQPLQQVKPQNIMEEPIMEYGTKQRPIQANEQDLQSIIKHQWQTIHKQNEIIMELVKKVK